MLPLCLRELFLTRVTGLTVRGDSARHFFTWLWGVTTLILVIWIVLERLATSAPRTHSNLCVGSPVRWCHLVSEPGGDGFGGACAVLRHRLDHVVHPIQDPLGGVLVVGQKGVRLREERVVEIRLTIKSINSFDFGVVLTHLILAVRCHRISASSRSGLDDQICKLTPSQTCLTSVRTTPLSGSWFPIQYCLLR